MTEEFLLDRLEKTLDLVARTVGDDDAGIVAGLLLVALSVDDLRQELADHRDLV